MTRIRSCPAAAPLLASTTMPPAFLFPHLPLPRLAMSTTIHKRPIRPLTQLRHSSPTMALLATVLQPEDTAAFPQAEATMGPPLLGSRIPGTATERTAMAATAVDSSSTAVAITRQARPKGTGRTTGGGGGGGGGNQWQRGAGYDH